MYRRKVYLEKSNTDQPSTKILVMNPETDMEQLDILQLTSCQDNAFDRTNKFKLPDEKESVYVYKIYNKIYGYVVFNIHDDLLWLGELSAVEHDIGVSLLEFVIDYAKTNNIYRIASNVNQENPMAVSMYEFVGFKKKFNYASRCMEIKIEK